MADRTDDLRELIALGRRRGVLTADDLQHALPLAQMSPRRIADLIMRLEQAGVAVEIDPAYLSPSRRPGAEPAPGRPEDPIALTPGPAAPAPGARRGVDLSPARASRARGSLTPIAAVALGGTAAVIAAAVLAVWLFQSLT